MWPPSHRQGWDWDCIRRLPQGAPLEQSWKPGASGVLALAAASPREDCHLLALNIISALTSPAFSPAAKPLYCLHTSCRCPLQAALGFPVSSTSSRGAMRPSWTCSLPLPALTPSRSGPMVPYPSVISPGVPLPPGPCTCHSQPGMLLPHFLQAFAQVSR